MGARASRRCAIVANPVVHGQVKDRLRMNGPPFERVIGLDFRFNKLIRISKRRIDR